MLTLTWQGQARAINPWTLQICKADINNKLNPARYNTLARWMWGRKQFQGTRACWFVKKTWSYPLCSLHLGVTSLLPAGKNLIKSVLAGELWVWNIVTKEQEALGGTDTRWHLVFQAIVKSRSQGWLQEETCLRTWPTGSGVIPHSNPHRKQMSSREDKTKVEHTCIQVFRKAWKLFIQRNTEDRGLEEVKKNLAMKFISEEWDM